MYAVFVRTYIRPGERGPKAYDGFGRRKFLGHVYTRFSSEVVQDAHVLFRAWIRTCDLVEYHPDVRSLQPRYGHVPFAANGNGLL